MQQIWICYKSRKTILTTRSYAKRETETPSSWGVAQNCRGVELQGRSLLCLFCVLAVVQLSHPYLPGVPHITIFVRMQELKFYSSFEDRLRKDV